MHVDVVVVGAGPSGLMTASELALAGVNVVVLERRTEPVGSRAGTILPRVLELFDARGMAQSFVERASAIRENPLIPFHIWAGMAPVVWQHLGSPFGYRLILPQNVTEEVLSARVADQGVEVVRGATMTGLEQNDVGVTVSFCTADGAERSLSADYVVGADGARSATRRLAGIGYEGHDATFTGIVADAMIEFPWQAARRSAHNERGWAAAFPFDTEGRVTRFTIVHADRRYVDRAEPVTAGEVEQCVREIFEEPLEIDELRWGSRYTDETRIASAFRERRILLVGESARVHYPASGVGMNFCLQDAFNLGWKLAAVVKGHSDESILDTYETERRPVAEELLRSVAAQCAVQFDFTPEGVAFKRFFEQRLLPLPEVNRQLARDLNGLAISYPRGVDDHALIGETAPELLLQTADGLVRVAELLRRQEFVLLDCTGDSRYRDLKFGDAPVRTQSGVPALVPPGMTNVQSLLIRPDAYVAWADEGPADPARARSEIERWLRIDR